MTEENNVQKVRICWLLQEQPAKNNKRQLMERSVINNYTWFGTGLERFDVMC